MKKPFWFTLIILLSVSLLGCPTDGNKTQPKSDKAIVTELIEDFGKKLQNVSLQAPKDEVAKSMQDNYSDYVSPGLLAKWRNDPLNAPGRLTSSPWPDRIRILAVEKLSDDAYEVKGEIIYITSMEKSRGGVAAKQPITLVVRKIEGRWLIDDATLGVYETTNSIVYRNTQYGFSFTLPKSWRGFSIVTGKWEGRALEGPRSGEVVETGPLLSIRHPLWTAAKPRQDIPIMVFTLDQWTLVQQEKISVGAAPIPPTELGRNNKYVFALPARYNFAFPPGFEEVEKILETHPLQPLQVSE